MTVSRRRRFAVLAATIAVIAVLCAACGDGDETGRSKAKTLVVGTSADFPPLTFRDPADPTKLIGFEIRMVASLMRHLGYKHRFEAIPFNGLIPAIQGGHVDLVVSDVYNTPARREVVDFVDYMQAGYGVLIRPERAGEFQSGYLSLCGKALGVLEGSSPQAATAAKGSKECTDAAQPAIKVQTYPATVDVLQQINNGRLDAMILDINALSYLQHENPTQYKLAFEDKSTRVKVGVVLKKDSPLKPEIEEAVRWYISSGEYQKEAKKWALPTDALLST
ncbi:MAG: ABC transporter substrate-binding protein [Actinomycetota bacterium]|nr:ABC transporter substrate-binding protein [Actinomycetota bacterium]